MCMRSEFSELTTANETILKSRIFNYVQSILDTYVCLYFEILFEETLFFVLLWISFRLLGDPLMILLLSLAWRFFTHDIDLTQNFLLNRSFSQFVSKMCLIWRSFFINKYCKGGNRKINILNFSIYTKIKLAQN